jgi:hypothetical protein
MLYFIVIVLFIFPAFFLLNLKQIGRKEGWEKPSFPLGYFG